MKETWRKEKERQELHNLLLILDLLDLDHSEPEIHQEKICLNKFYQVKKRFMNCSPLDILKVIEKSFCNFLISSFYRFQLWCEGSVDVTPTHQPG